jgi:hypothetical protein
MYFVRRPERRINVIKTVQNIYDFKRAEAPSLSKEVLESLENE